MLRSDYLDPDAVLTEKVAKVNKSYLGRLLNSFASKIGGSSRLAGLNALGAIIVGAIVSYPIYLIGGYWLAMIPILFTLAVASSIFIPIVHHNFKIKYGRNAARGLLMFAIMFSLPFGILSLPLLHRMSRK